MKELLHKGYRGSVEFSEADNCFFGKVLGLPNPTLFLYEGQTLEELELDFKNLIDEYLDGCEGIKLKTPNSLNHEIKR